VIFRPKGENTEKQDCWKIYSIISDKYRPKPDRIRDWISTAKENGYMALHGTFYYEEKGTWVEVQIRSERMHEVAEFGIAAHWRYKGIELGSEEVERQVKRFRELLKHGDKKRKLQQDDNAPVTNPFKIPANSKEILVFTHKGELRSIARNATVLDFAYEIHSELGNHCIGAKVNRETVSADQVLRSGDQVQIISSKSQMPKREWLSFCVTNKAKDSIKAAIKSNRKTEIDRGKQTLRDMLKELERPVSAEVFHKLLITENFSNKDDLYYKIGTGIITKSKLKELLKNRSKQKKIKYWNIEIQIGFESYMTADNNRKPTSKDNLAPDYNIILSDCCKPKPKDNICGFVSDSNIIVHKDNCCIAMQSVKEKNDIHTFKWKHQKAQAELVRIYLKGEDDTQMLNDVNNTLVQILPLKIRSLHYEGYTSICEIKIDLYVVQNKNLGRIIDDLKNIKGIKSVKQIL